MTAAKDILAELEEIGAVGDRAKPPLVEMKDEAPAEESLVMGSKFGLPPEFVDRALALLETSVRAQTELMSLLAEMRSGAREWKPQLVKGLGSASPADEELDEESDEDDEPSFEQFAEDDYDDEDEEPESDSGVIEGTFEPQALAAPPPQETNNRILDFFNEERAKGNAGFSADEEDE